MQAEGDETVAKRTVSARLGGRWDRHRKLILRHEGATNGNWCVEMPNRRKLQGRLVVFSTALAAVSNALDSCVWRPVQDACHPPVIPRTAGLVPVLTSASRVIIVGCAQVLAPIGGASFMPIGGRTPV